MALFRVCVCNRKNTHTLSTGAWFAEIPYAARTGIAVIHVCDNRGVAVGSIFAKRTTIGSKAVSYLSLYIVCAMAAERQSDTFAVTHGSIAKHERSFGWHDWTLT